MDYFDSLIAALAEESGSQVITTDESIRGVVQAEW
jgi:predicted nucleic acid-binding protein